jgi:hypothetical protein
MFPISRVLWVFNEIYNAADQEFHNESDAITAQLQQLYSMLESGDITEAQFDCQEAELLDRLDEIHERGSVIDVEDRIAMTKCSERREVRTTRIWSLNE